jgi:hypothetical protein
VKRIKKERNKPGERKMKGKTDNGRNTVNDRKAGKVVKREQTNHCMEQSLGSS